MAVLRPRVPIRFESVEKMVNGHDLQSLIIPVEEGLRRFNRIYEDMMSSLCGAFLILRGETGSGKTTLVHTLGLFLKDVQTVSIRRDESVRETLRSLGPSDGTFRAVVIESREALSDTSDVEIESIILAINAFVRSRAGERTVVVWPCNSEPIAEKLVASARQIGGEALLGVEEPVFRYHGPPRSEYLRDRAEYDRDVQFRCLAGRPGDCGGSRRATCPSGRDHREVPQSPPGRGAEES